MTRKDTATPPFSYNILWEKDYLEGGGHMGVAVDSLNNIIVCGINTGENKGVVVKYDQEGRELWSDHDFPVPFQIESEKERDALSLPPMLARVLNQCYGYFFDLAVDKENNVILVGTFIEESGMRSTILVKKYAPDGATIWEKTYTPFLINLGTCVGVDAKNNILVAGGGSTTTLGFQAFVMKLAAANGRRMWKRVHRTGTVAIYNDLVIDEQDYIYTAGFTSDGSQVSLLLTKLGGAWGWQRQTFIGARATPVSIALAGLNDLVVAGKTELGTDTQYLLKCTRTFQQQWETASEIEGFLYGTVVYGETYLIATGARASLDRYYAALFDLNTGNHRMDLDLGSRVSGRLDDYLRGIAVDRSGALLLAGARTVGRTIKCRLKGPVPPPSPTPPQPHHSPPVGSWLEKLLRWLSDLF